MDLAGDEPKRKGRKMAGADFSLVSFLSKLGSREFMEKLRYLQSVVTMIEDMEKPVIAAINGYALGGGLDLALACDLRIAVEGAKIGEQYVKVGIMPDLGGTQRLPRLVGLAKAKEMIFEYKKKWLRKTYPQKKVQVIYVEEENQIIVITVKVFYGKWR